MVYSLGGPEWGSLLFLFPKLPVHKTVSFRTTMADTEGRLIGLMFWRSSASTWKRKSRESEVHPGPSTPNKCEENLSVLMMVDSSSNILNASGSKQQNIESNGEYTLHFNGHNLHTFVERTPGSHSFKSAHFKEGMYNPDKCISKWTQWKAIFNSRHFKAWCETEKWKAVTL